MRVNVTVAQRTQQTDKSTAYTCNTRITIVGPMHVFNAHIMCLRAVIMRSFCMLAKMLVGLGSARDPSSGLGNNPTASREFGE